MATTSLAAGGSHILSAEVSISATGPVISAVAGKVIIVVGYTLFGGGAVDAYFTTNVTKLPGYVLSVATAGQGIHNPIGPLEGYFRTIAGDPLGLNLSASVAVKGVIWYWTRG